jgi:hypothetical protein
MLSVNDSENLWCEYSNLPSPSAYVNSTTKIKSTKMAKKKTPEENAKVLIDKMFEIAGHEVKYEDIVDRKDNWFWDWTMTMEQRDQWMEWGVEYLRKNNRYTTKKQAEINMSWVDMQWGLKVSDYEHTND